MEFLLGNPYSTPVGQCIEASGVWQRMVRPVASMSLLDPDSLSCGAGRGQLGGGLSLSAAGRPEPCVSIHKKATDGSLQNEDWMLNMEICDIINETEEGPKDAMRALKKRLNGNRNFREVMLGLTVLETCVKNCGHRFHVLVTSRDFIEGILVKIISPKNNPPAIVQDKVLSLIQAWADAFRSSTDLTGVVHIYEELKRKGIEFPMADLDALSPIHTPQRGVPEVDPGTHKYKAPSQANAASETAPMPAAAAHNFNPTQIPTVSGPITANPEQIARLRSELDIVRGNVKVMSEMLTEMVPGQEEASDLELLQELNRTCRAMQHRIVELISRVSNDEVTEELLHANDDLNNIFLRYERYERYRIGRAAQNNGVLSEASEEDNLIDLGPGSPAVVTPRIIATPIHTPTLQPPVPAASAPSLSTQLAGLHAGADSVSGTLSSLTSQNTKEDFDMFAHTRSSSLADQRKNIIYEDPQALGGLASALDIRQQNATGPSVKGPNAELEPIDGWLITQGMIPVSQSSVMDDIEEWLGADVKVEEPEEGVTSEDFDKFLEERAKASDKALPLPSTTELRAPASAASSSRKKAERTEDNLFAL
ncbi:TOM1-like protein 2 [Triplophysa tibetana]|uniref:TOM1-like protein 2 n=1 Tax=Triplophysa tibetana TaxID=1572043 RepID=A0A5A9N8F4_9TELE|nr:TOM1-like protein 2 [Triplophysa tibetana]